jgi:hypothetical protein
LTGQHMSGLTDLRPRDQEEPLLTRKEFPFPPPTPLSPFFLLLFFLFFSSFFFLPFFFLPFFFLLLLFLVFLYFVQLYVLYTTGDYKAFTDCDVSEARVIIAKGCCERSGSDLLREPWQVCALTTEAKIENVRGNE